MHECPPFLKCCECGSPEMVDECPKCHRAVCVNCFEDHRCEPIGYDKTLFTRQDVIEFLETLQAGLQNLKNSVNKALDNLIANEDVISQHSKSFVKGELFAIDLCIDRIKVEIAALERGKRPLIHTILEGS
jgi:hypothetical protein